MTPFYVFTAPGTMAPFFGSIFEIVSARGLYVKFLKKIKLQKIFYARG
jgi:hypothetical protein